MRKPYEKFTFYFWALWRSENLICITNWVVVNLDVADYDIISTSTGYKRPGYRFL